MKPLRKRMESRGAIPSQRSALCDERELPAAFYGSHESHRPYGSHLLPVIGHLSFVMAPLCPQKPSLPHSTF
jgi:hypothetical protein